MDKAQVDSLFIDQLKRHLSETLDENERLKEEIKQYKLIEAYLIARLKSEGGEE